MRKIAKPVFIGAAFVFAMITWADAQSQTSKIPRVGILGGSTAEAAKRNIDAFRNGMRELGWIEGKNVVFEYRHADGDLSRLAGLAAELVRLQVDVILAGGTQTTMAAKQATSTIPIVVGGAGDLVGAGLVESLARPGGNITGSTVISPDLSGKRLELLKEVIPNAVRIAVLLYPGSRTDRDELKQIEAVAQTQKLRVQTVEVRHANDFQSAFTSIKRENAQALMLLQSSFTSSHRRQLLDLATKNRLPTMCESARWSIDGCLFVWPGHG
jgi:ABC-type uncharacterized transport system substrate-binding protein